MRYIQTLIYYCNEKQIRVISPRRRDNDGNLGKIDPSQAMLVIKGYVRKLRVIIHDVRCVDHNVHLWFVLTRNRDIAECGVNSKQREKQNTIQRFEP